MDKLERAKEVIKKHAADYECGIFNTRNLVGDIMEVLYESSSAEEYLRIEGCCKWSYLEVFGLSAEEFGKLAEYYRSLTI